MNYRTTFDTVNIPANTKKNVKALNESALERQQAQNSASSKTEDTLGANSQKTKSSSGPGGGDSDSESDGEDGGKSVKDQSEKEKKKKEWCARIALFSF